MTKLKLIIIAGFCAVALAIVVPVGKTQTKVETAGQKFKSIKVLNDMPADQMGKVMNMISASLGVDCKFCHASNDGDYEKEGFEHKDTARRMMKMVFDLNKTQFDGRPEINCNSCHNGRSHPQPSFPLSAAKTTDARPKQPEVKPTADEILAKYEIALGGKDRIAKITSREIKASRAEPDGKTVEPEEIFQKGNRFRSDTIYGKYVVSEIFDGVDYLKFGGEVKIDLKADELEQGKREAQLFGNPSIKTIYATLEFRFLDRIDGRDVHMILATTADKKRERLYFDAVSGLLVRRVASSPTVFGNHVFQVDYQDYKDFGGVKLPTTIKYAMPQIQWTRKITDVKINPAINASKFAIPAK
ncbi:MAG: c-type cytochrome [Acidobacteria bacterium]|nr:c-type cytochrome [Acidobacteriota bacterium]